MNTENLRLMRLKLEIDTDIPSRYGQQYINVKCGNIQIGYISRKNPRVEGSRFTYQCSIGNDRSIYGEPCSSVVFDREEDGLAWMAEIHKKRLINLIKNSFEELP